MTGVPHQPSQLLSLRSRSPNPKFPCPLFLFPIVQLFRDPPEPCRIPCAVLCDLEPRFCVGSIEPIDATSNALWNTTMG